MTMASLITSAKAAGRPGTDIPSQGISASNWSIGIYAGDSPLRLAQAGSVVNPVLSRQDVTDVEARFVADPFMLRAGATWHMFFEVMPASSRAGVIGHATSSDGLAWRYDRVVLEEAFHLSYPHVFEWDGEHYLVPESHQSGVTRLYRAVHFPFDWTPVATMLVGEWVEPTLFRRDGRWWMFAAAPPRRATRLHLFCASELSGPWREHPASPVVQDDVRTARPAGRVVEHDGALLRFAQDCSRRYGERVKAFEIVELTSERYRERAVEGGLAPAASTGVWNSARMHHVDAHRLGENRWLCCVDGDGGG